MAPGTVLAQKHLWFKGFNWFNSQRGPLWIKTIESIKSKVFLCQNGPRGRCESKQLKQVSQLNQLNRGVAELIDLIVLSHNGPPLWIKSIKS